MLELVVTIATRWTFLVPLVAVLEILMPQGGKTPVERTGYVMRHTLYICMCGVFTGDQLLLTLLAYLVMAAVLERVWNAGKKVNDDQKTPEST